MTDSHSTDQARPGGNDSSLSANIRKHWVLCTVMVLINAFVAWRTIQAVSGPKAKTAAAAPIPVATAAVTVGNLDVYLDELGTVTPVYTVTVVSRVAGEITEIHFKEGQLVKTNDLLAVIDPRPYEAALLQGQGQLARDQALLKNARIDLVRYQNAYKDHAIPQQELATQQATVDQDEAAVTLDQGNLDAAQVNVDYTRIRSPIDGRVGLRNIDLGNVVPANGTTGLCVITQLQPITVIFTIAEDDIDDVTATMALGRPMQVLALDRSKQRLIATGTLLTVDNQVNTTTGTVRARATFPNTHNELFPSQFVNARLLVKTLTAAHLAPQAAIQRNNDTTFVYVVGPDGTVRSRNITILATEAETSAVTGVDPGEELVTDGFDKLQNGSKVSRKSLPPKGSAAQSVQPRAAPLQPSAQPAAGTAARSRATGSE
ncbi:MAG TPA: efflux RND transporter periplasmic adaptor subunit [Steroidobacteraceae bacterium]|nr:efflux RND transporter periplasmic adaptor subunit [Steroidobacteraceae bacterium]